MAAKRTAKRKSAGLTASGKLRKGYKFKKGGGVVRVSKRR